MRMVDVNFISRGVRRKRALVELLPLVSGCSAKPPPSSGNWKYKQKLASLAGVMAKLVGHQFHYLYQYIKMCSGLETDLR